MRALDEPHHYGRSAEQGEAESHNVARNTGEIPGWHHHSSVHPRRRAARFALLPGSGRRASGRRRGGVSPVQGRVMAREGGRSDRGTGVRHRGAREPTHEQRVPQAPRLLRWRRRGRKSARGRAEERRGRNGPSGSNCLAALEIPERTPRFLTQSPGAIYQCLPPRRATQPVPCHLSPDQETVWSTCEVPGCARSIPGKRLAD